MAPARMMTSEHTVARIGPADEDVGEQGYWPFPPRGRPGTRGPRAPIATGAPSRIFCTPETISFSPGLRPGLHDVVVSDQRPGLDRALARHGRSALAGLGHVGEELAVDAVQGHDGHGQGRRLRPDDPGADELLGAEAARRSRAPALARTDWVAASTEGATNGHRLGGRATAPWSSTRCTGRPTLRFCGFLDGHVDVDLEARRSGRWW